MKILKYKRRIYYNETMKLYSGCQKNVPVFKRFFLQPLMPQFRNSEHYYEKRYSWLLFLFLKNFLAPKSGNCDQTGTQ
jgi:hypothetical protein